MAFGTKLTAISEYLFRRLFKVLFRYDVFISYARRDGKGYALKLKEQLTRLDFSCFLDYDELPAGNSLNRTLKRAIKKSATIIVVGTEGALQSRYVDLEVGEFARTGRAIIPIDFEGSLANAPWPVVKERDLVWVDETKDALAKSAPSPPVADAIDKLFKYTRRNVRVRGQVIATAALFLLGAAISVVVIRQQVAAANVQRREAEDARGRALQEKGNAEAATKNAKEQEGFAKASAKKADDEKKEARRQAGIAETQTAEAEKQATIARAKAEEARQQQIVAERQQQLASSRELSANAVSQLQIDPELSLVLASKSAEAARTFEAEDALRRSLLESHVRAVAEGHRGEVSSASFSPDGEFAVASGDDNTVRVLRLSDGQVVAALPVQTKPRWGASFSPDGQFIVTADDDKTARVWEWRANRVMAEPLRHPKAVTGARFSYDGATVMTTSDDNAARVWDTKTGKMISPMLKGLVLHDRADPNAGLTIKPFSPDGRHVFFASMEGDEGVTRGVWDVSTGRVLPALREKLPIVLGADINVEQKLMITQSVNQLVGAHTNQPWAIGPTELWDLNSGTSFAVLHGDFSGVALSPDGRFVVTANIGNTASLWKVPEKRERENAEKSSDSEKTDNLGEEQVLDNPLWVLSGHRGPVKSAVFSPDGRFVLTASDDRTARVWDVTTGREVSVLRGHRRGVLSATFSPDGSRMITSSDDGMTRIWDAAMGQGFIEPRRNGEVDQALFGAQSNLVLTSDDHQDWRVWNAGSGESLPHTWSGHAAALSPDGKLIVTAKQEVPRVYDAATGGVRLELPVHSGAVLSAVYSADGRFIATAASDKVVRVLEVKTGKVLKESTANTEDGRPLLFSPGSGELLLMGSQLWQWKTDRPPVGLPEFGGQAHFGAFSPDGRLVAGPGRGQGVGVWDTSTGCRIKILMRHNSVVSGAAFGPDGHSVLSVDPYAAKLWQLPATLKCEGQDDYLKETLDLDHSRTGTFSKQSAFFSNNGELIVLSGNNGEVQVWDAAAKIKKFSLDNASRDKRKGVFSPDGKLIVTTSEKGNARVWDSGTGKLVRTLEGTAGMPVSAASFSSDSKLIVTVSDPRFNSVTMWDAGSGQRTGNRMRGHSASFSPDGTSVLTVSGGDQARLFDVSAGHNIAELQSLTGTVTHLGFSDDGLRVMVGTSDRKVGVWETASGRNLARRDYDGDIETVAVGPGGKVIATITKANFESVAEVWDTEGEKALKVGETGVGSVTLSPDGRFVVTTTYDATGAGSDDTKVWDIGKGGQSPVADLPGHFAAFSSEGKRIATISSKMVRVWDTGGWETSTELRGQTGDIKAAAFSPDSKFIVTTADRESTALLWNAETGAVETELFGETSYGLKSAAFSPDGRSILLVGEDKRARLYACVMCGGLDSLLGRARERFARHRRELTPDEQKKFIRQSPSTVSGWRPAGLVAP
jgi:WD40 repeat protein